MMSWSSAQAVLRHFDDLERVYSKYRESAEPLHRYRKRQWSFVAGIAEPFGEMKEP